MGSPEWVIWNVTGHTLLWLTRATCSWWWIWSNKVIKVDYRWSKYDYYLHIEGLFFGCLSFTSAPLLLMTFFQQFVKCNHPREEALSQADPFPLPCSSQDHLRKGKSFYHSGQEWVSSLFWMQSMNPRELWHDSTSSFVHHPKTGTRPIIWVSDCCGERPRRRVLTSNPLFMSSSSQ